MVCQAVLNPQSPIQNPQSAIQNPQSPINRQSPIANQCPTTGTNDESTYAYSIEMRPITTMSKMLCLIVNRNSRLSSSGVMPVAATATAMLCSEIILPTTPAAEFTDAVSTGLMLNAFAVTT